MTKRYRKDYKVDGWPITDTHRKTYLHADDLIVILNDYENNAEQQQKRIDALELALRVVKVKLTNANKEIQFCADEALKELTND